MDTLTKNELRNYCYKDLQYNAMEIIRLITDPYSMGKKDLSDLFSDIDEDELNNRFFLGINWKTIVDIAISAMSKQETYNYLRGETTK